jgi:hypothetical protein
MSRKHWKLTNRGNPTRSTGPRTVAGKLRASRNALKHGLNVSIRHDGGLGQEIEILAAAIAGDRPTATARDVADAVFDLKRVQRYKVSLIEDKVNNMPLVVANDKYQIENCGWDVWKYAQACMQALPAIAKIERYERRALSRYRRAMLKCLLAAGKI